MRTALAFIVLALSGADLALTLWLLRQPGRYEANPLLRRLVRRPGWFAAVKLGITGALVIGLWLAPRGVPGLVLLTVLFGGVVVWNVRQVTRR